MKLRRLNYAYDYMKVLCLTAYAVKENIGKKKMEAI